MRALMSLIALLALGGCVLPEVEKIDGATGGGGVGGGGGAEPTEDHACPGLFLDFDADVTHTFSIDDNPISDDTCDGESGFHRAIYRVTPTPGQDVRVTVQPLDGGTFVIEGYFQCPITSETAGQCYRSMFPGDQAFIDTEATGNTIRIWGSGGRYEVTLHLHPTSM